jgi:hypothetical protein
MIKMLWMTVSHNSWQKVFKEASGMNRYAEATVCVKPDAFFVNNVLAACAEWLGRDGAEEATSQITGSGAIHEAEMLFSQRFNGHPSLMLPSATYGLYSALKALGVKAGDEVIVPRYDWTASLAAVRAIGAVPVCAPVDSSLTIDPTGIERLINEKTRAIICCNLYGIPCDVASVREVLPSDVVIIEDCAQAAMGSSIDGMKVGMLSDIAIWSFGPSKELDCGEAGMAVCKDWYVWEKLLKQIGHPARQLIGGIAQPVFDSFSIRPHPMAAILLVHALHNRAVVPHGCNNAEISNRLKSMGAHVIGNDGRRVNASRSIPVTLTCQPNNEILEKLDCLSARRSQVMDISAVVAGVNPSTHALGSCEIWLIPVDSNVSWSDCNEGRSTDENTFAVVLDSGTHWNNRGKEVEL